MIKFGEIGKLEIFKEKDTLSFITNRIVSSNLNISYTPIRINNRFFQGNSNITLEVQFQIEPLENYNYNEFIYSFVNKEFELIDGNGYNMGLALISGVENFEYYNYLSDQLHNSDVYLLKVFYKVDSVTLR